MEAVLYLPLALIGVIAGATAKAALNAGRDSGKPLNDFLRLHARRDKYFGLAVAPIKLLTVAVVMISAMLIEGHQSKLLAFSSALFLTASLVLTVKRIEAINALARQWSINPPEAWEPEVERWKWHQNGAAVTAALAYPIFLVACLSAGSA